MFKRVSILVFFAVSFFCCNSGIVEAGQTWESLSTPPSDSLDAANVKIWIPISHTHTCRTTVSIHDSAGNIIRQLMSEFLKKDYYNIYWDKRNDSGEFMPVGQYDYFIDDCGKKRSGKVTANYKEWELWSNLLPEETNRPYTIGIELLKDSAFVSIEVIARMGNIVAKPFNDSLLIAGKHYLLWNCKGENKIRNGQYRLAITVGDFTYYRRAKVR